MSEQPKLLPEQIAAIRESLEREYDDLIGWRTKFGAALMDLGLMLDAQSPAQPEWQPIETAPKDGDSVLLCACRTFGLDSNAYYEDGFIHTVDCCPNTRLIHLVAENTVLRRALEETLQVMRALRGKAFVGDRIREREPLLKNADAADAAARAALVAPTSTTKGTTMNDSTEQTEDVRCIWQSFNEEYKFWRTQCDSAFEKLQERCPKCGKRVWLTGFDAWWEARKSYHP